MPARLVDAGLADIPEPGIVSVIRGRLADGFVAPGENLVVLTEADLTGNRVSTGEVTKLASRRRNAVQLETLVPGDYVVHAQHGIEFADVELPSLDTQGAPAETAVRL